jgi:hypothetical protein
MASIVARHGGMAGWPFLRLVKDRNSTGGEQQAAQRRRGSAVAQGLAQASGNIGAFGKQVETPGQEKR